MTGGSIRWVAGLAVLLATAAFAAPAEAGRQGGHPSGIVGTVVSGTCPGPCVEPPPPPPVYSGPATVTVRRASDGGLVASQDVSDGQFKLRLKRGQYDVSAATPNPPPCQPRPGQVCPAESGSQSAAIIAPCLTGETKRVAVRRHHFTHVQLQVSNACVVQPTA
jgi:hypothetical protein